jgi:hypothetical protein
MRDDEMVQSVMGVVGFWCRKGTYAVVGRLAAAVRCNAEEAAKMGLIRTSNSAADLPDIVTESIFNIPRPMEATFH